MLLECEPDSMQNSRDETWAVRPSITRACTVLWQLPVFPSCSADITTYGVYIYTHNTILIDRAAIGSVCHVFEGESTLPGLLLRSVRNESSQRTGLRAPVDACT